MKTILQLLNFANKTVIVTGGARGIGLGIVKRFSEVGANIMIADTVDDGVGDKIAKKSGKHVRYFRCDVSSEEQVNILVAATIRLFGSIDVLINNAGIFPSKPLLETDLAFWEKVQAINLRGSFLFARAAGKHMVEMKEGGSIIQVGSIDSLHPSRMGLAAYDASKHGVWGMVKNLALELASNNIRVNMIAPGGIDTEGVRQDVGKIFKNKKEQDKALQEFANRVPLKRMGVPDDIATAAVFLASDAASYITGTALVIDGGYLLT